MYSYNIEWEQSQEKESLLLCYAQILLRKEIRGSHCLNVQTYGMCSLKV